jgi:hypothetical protein
MTLVTTPNLADPDRTYQRLIELHEGRTEQQSQALNARLILLLVNHIGSDDVVAEAIAAARGTGDNA